MRTIALAVFCLVFVLVTLAGFWAVRWRRPATGLHSLEEWGLAGRGFGTLTTWFLIGGDLYTAYTVIAVPAAMYGTGALGFFALPYVVLAYPYMLLVMPRIWRICRQNGYITLADLVRGLHRSRSLEVAVALTGVLALLPYIALQLVGMRVVIAAMGVRGEWPLAAAFAILAAYTYTSGLRAPAVIAVVKDLMLYVMVLACVIVLPIRTGGWSRIFEASNTALTEHHPPATVYLQQGQFLPYASLAFGSALALMLYPHTATAVLSARSAQAVARNAALLPAYSFLLGMIALLGYVALAAGVVTHDTNLAIPLLLLKMFPEWFAGFCLAAIAVGALVPAAIMSIAAANLVTRNLYGAFARHPLTGRAESGVAKAVSLGVKLLALVFVLRLPATYAIEMQLLGGIWIGQIFPAVVLGTFIPRLNRRALLLGLAAGLSAGTLLAWSQGLRSSVVPLHLLGHAYRLYAALPALALNLAITLLGTALARGLGRSGRAVALQRAV